MHKLNAYFVLRNNLFLIAGLHNLVKLTVVIKNIVLFSAPNILVSF